MSLIRQQTECIESTVNSSDSILTAGSTFTGTSELNSFTDVMVSLKTDQNGTLYMEFSSDGTNWDSSLTFLYETDRINPPHILVKGARYYRTRFTNTSASDQTFFRLQTDYGQFNKLTSPINGVVSDNYDAINTRPTDYKYEVALGRRQGRVTWNKFGYNDDIDIGTEVLWSVGGLFTRMSTARTLSVVSTSASDGVAGTGATRVIIYGIDSNRKAQTEVVTMNGTTPVITTGTWLGVNRISVYLCGTAESNVGTITATATTDLTIQGEIPATEGSTQQCIFFTQSGHTALVDWLHLNVNKISGGSSPVVTIKGYVYSFVSQSKYLIFRDIVDTSIENNYSYVPSQPFVVGEKSVFWFEATTNTNNTVASLRFSLIEVRNQ